MRTVIRVRQLEDNKFESTLLEGPQDFEVTLVTFEQPSRELAIHAAKVWHFEEVSDMRIHTDGKDAVKKAMEERIDYIWPEGA